MERFASITPIYTGGGIYVLYGELTNGTYFMADTPDYDVRIMTENPLDAWDESGCPEWQEARLVRDLESSEAVEFIADAIRWIKANKPDTEDCNYSMAEMDDIAEDLDEIRGRKGAGIMKYGISIIDDNERLVEVWDSEDDLIIEHYINTEDTNYFGDFVEGIKGFTYEENIEALEVFFAEWGADAETTERILADLSGWLEEKSLTEVGRIKREMDECEYQIEVADDNINYDLIQADKLQKQIEELQKKHARLLKYISANEERVKYWVKKHEELDEQLKATESEV